MGGVKSSVSDRKAAIFEIVFVCVISAALMALIYPDLYVRHIIRFTSGHDAAMPFFSAFVHANNLVSGGLQLWDRFDQVNHAYAALGTGFYALPALLEGAFYALTHKFYARPAEAFQHLHTIAYFAICLVFRSAGGWALLSLYPTGRTVRIISLLILNTLLAGQTYSGWLVGFMYGLAPLVMYYLVVFFRGPTPASAFWILAAFTFAVAQDPLMAVEYFYQPFHFMILAAIAMLVWDKVRTGRFSSADRAPSPGGISFMRRPAVLVAAVSMGVIIAMYFFYFLLLHKTFFIAGSGFAGTEGRLGRLFDPFYYLSNKNVGWAEISEVLSASVNYAQNDWWVSWIFVGASALGLALLGLIYDRSREKWLYGAALLFTALIQTPRTELSIGTPAHYLNAFTNPFAFLVVHLQGSALLLPYFLLPLVAMGLAAIMRRREEAGEQRGFALRDVIAIAALMALAGAVIHPWPQGLQPSPAIDKLPHGPGLQAAAIFAGLAMIVVLSRLQGMRNTAIRISVVVIAGLSLLGDEIGLKTYLTNVPMEGDRILPRVFKGMEQLGEVVIDYQNPAILPFPRHLWVDEWPTTPVTDQAWRCCGGVNLLPFAFYFDRENYLGAFYHSIFLYREFQAPTLYELRAAAYKDAASDAVKEEFRRNDRYVFHADHALDARSHDLSELLAANADRTTVLLQDPAGGAIVGLSEKAVTPALPILPPRRPESLRFELAGDTAKIRDQKLVRELSFPLPEGFPSWMATTIFTRDRDEIRASLDGKPLVAAQGRLIRPMTFDVNNVATGRLVIAVARNTPARGVIKLEVDGDPLIESVWRRRNDSIGIDYRAPSDGWMVIRNPYEGGWRASVNGSSAPLYIADTSAMAVPVKEGLNRVLLEYKPGWFNPARLLVSLGAALIPVLALILLVDILRRAAIAVSAGDPVDKTAARHYLTT